MSMRSVKLSFHEKIGLAVLMSIIILLSEGNLLNVVTGWAIVLQVEVITRRKCGSRIEWIAWPIALSNPIMYLSIVQLLIYSHDQTQKRGFVAHTGYANPIYYWLAELVRPELELEYVGPIDFGEPNMDELSVIKDIEQVTKWLNVTNNLRKEIVYLALATSSYIIGGPIAFAAALLFGVIIELTGDDGSREVIKRYPSRRICRREGIYRVGFEFMGMRNHVGFAYMREGTLYSKLHVTKGRGIDTGDGDILFPCYMNEQKDNVAYGSNPKWSRVNDGEEVTVAVVGPHSNRVMKYTSRVTVLDDGKVVFRGLKSIPGCSGSPIFKDYEVEVTDDTGTRTILEKRLVGCLGWSASCAMTDDIPRRTAVEAFGIEPGIEHDVEPAIIDGSVTQLFMHPGSGKTRSCIPSLAARGISKYGKVYITGPTRVVCSEIYAALSQEFERQVALVTSDADAMQRGSDVRPIQVMAHATALSMLTKNATKTGSRGLWIMDEAHFMNTKSLMLKDLLRSKVKIGNRGALVEMTATGYDFRQEKYVMKAGSNYEISDVMMNDTGMLTSMYSESASRLKNVVFVTSIDGKEETSSKRIGAKLKALGYNHVHLNRKTFDKEYSKAREMTNGYVLTTDISECGANFAADVVYDFQRTTKAVMAGRFVGYESRLIDQGQRIQRRGRVGRRKAGTYVSPGEALPVIDMDRVEHHDRSVFANSLGIEIDDPTVAPLITLTVQQLQSWIDTNDRSIESPFVADMIFSHDGRRRNDRDLMTKVKTWLDMDVVTIKVRDVTFNPGFWDERDRTKIEYVLSLHGYIDISDKETHWRDQFFNYLTYVRKRIKGGVIDTGVSGTNQVDHTKRSNNTEDDERSAHLSENAHFL